MNDYSANVLWGIPIDTYSHILAIGVLVIATLVILHILGYIFSRNIRAKTHRMQYWSFFKMIGILSLGATVFALTYQFGYKLQVCELCWWQRIFMFPIEFIVFFTLLKKITYNELPILALAAFGTFFAGYHYYLHFMSWVMKNDSIMSFTNCSVGGILPSCTDPAGVVIFGWLTIPFMALVIFVTIMWLSILAMMNRRQAETVTEVHHGI